MVLAAFMKNRNPLVYYKIKVQVPTNYTIEQVGVECSSISDNFTVSNTTW